MCVRPLSTGRLMGYAVEVRSDDSPILDAIEEILKESFSCVVVERVFDELTMRLVADLCRETGSRIYCLPRCSICGRPEPFPVATMGAGASVGRCYCARCTAEAWGP
ncbi:MAG: hypothetical protein N3B12_04770 [Armatimonadetes bacterium]|nr:hypothetical protein [Armatimonadota bacterium]